jgi:hypothetical protein
MNADGCGAVDCQRAATGLLLWQGDGVLVADDVRGAMLVCASHGLGGVNLSRLVGVIAKVCPLPCCWCGLAIGADERAETDEPLHRECRWEFEDRTQEIPIG